MDTYGHFSSLPRGELRIGVEQNTNQWPETNYWYVERTGANFPELYAMLMQRAQTSVGRTAHLSRGSSPCRQALQIMRPLLALLPLLERELGEAFGYGADNAELHRVVEARIRDISTHNDGAERRPYRGT